MSQPLDGEGSWSRAGVGHRTTLRPVALDRRPLVSVVIPCYNYEAYVADAIRSVLDQPGVDTQVIVVDDCSQDGSRETVRSIISTDDRVQLVEHPTNRGPVDTFNDGLPHVRGDYVVRLDADDLLTPGSLARSVAVLEAVPSVGLVYGHPLHFSALPLLQARTTARRWVVWPGRRWLRDRCRTGVNVITAPEVVMRSAVVEKVGGQRPLAHTHDMEMWLRIAAVSDIAYLEGADQAWHREHPGSLSERITVGRGDLQDRRDAFHVLFDWTEAFLPETADLRRLSERALADEALTAVVHMHDRGRVDHELEEFLLAFAESCDTGKAPLPHKKAVSRARARGTGPLRPWLVARAAGRHLQTKIHYRRWHRHGVFR